MRASCEDMGNLRSAHLLEGPDISTRDSQQVFERTQVRVTGLLIACRKLRLWGWTVFRPGTRCSRFDDLAIGIPRRNIFQNHTGT